MFLREVKSRLRRLADSNGVTVLDEGHPDYLPTKVLLALELMLNEQAAAEVVAAATGGSHAPLDSLYKFFERDFSPSGISSGTANAQYTGCCNRPRNCMGCMFFMKNLHTIHCIWSKVSVTWKAKSI